MDGMMRSGTTLMMNLLDNTPSCLVLPFEDGIIRGIYHHKNEFDKAFQKKDFHLLRNCLFHTKYWVLEKRSDKELFSFKIPREEAERIHFSFQKFDTEFKYRMNQLEQWNIKNFIDTFLSTVSKNINFLPNFENTSHVFMKTPGSTSAIPLFLDTFEDASVIYMIRDPRASYASLKQYSEENNSTIQDIPLSYLIQWQNNVKLIHDLKEKYKDRVKIVQYENLVSNTEEVMKHVSDFLNIEYHQTLCKPIYLVGIGMVILAILVNNKELIKQQLIDGKVTMMI